MKLNFYEESLLHMEPRFVDPFTDFGFKKLFGEEPNKELLQDFLNELLVDREGQIVELTYLKNEQLDSSPDDRKAFFDLYCKNEHGERFIVELQKVKQRHFKDRTIYYSTFPIREQATRAEWDYALKAVYLIAILDFEFTEHRQDRQKYRHDIQLMDTQTHQVFYDKLTYIYLEMPKFDKPVEALTNRYEKWLYVIKNLGRLEEKPVQLQERIFNRLFDAAEVASYDLEQRLRYNETLKIRRDYNNVMNTARYEGREEGRQEAQRRIIQNGLQLGLTTGALAELTGLPIDRIEAIITTLNSSAD